MYNILFGNIPIVQFLKLKYVDFKNEETNKNEIEFIVYF
jgi:hypothetical protein